MASKSKEYNWEYLSYKPEAIPVTADNYQDEFLYGKSIEKIKTKDIIGQPWYNVFAWHTFKTWNNAVVTQTITWVWFTPRLIEFKASWWWASISMWQSTGTSFNYSLFYTNWSASWWFDSSHCINCYITAWWSAAAYVSAVSNDWFTLTWVFSWAMTSVEFSYICYW